MVRKICYFLLLAISLSSCGTGWVPTELDRMIGQQGQTELNSNPNLYKILDEADYPLAYQKLEDIRDQILNSGNIKYKEEFSWELKIIEDDSVINAFCMPGGYIYVYTGLIKYLDSEAALAGVIGHEMAHADLRHSTNQLVKNLGLSIVLQVLLGGSESNLIQMGANLISLSFSRSDETEADMKSVEYLYHTPYDARGASYFFEKLKKENKDEGTVEFVSTHPNPDNRVLKIHEKWQELGAKVGKKNIDNYQKLIEELP